MSDKSIQLQCAAHHAEAFLDGPCHHSKQDSIHDVCFSCSFEDSPSEPVDPDTSRSPAAPQRPIAALGALNADRAVAEAQQAKHAGMGGGRVPRGPPQQSRCKWQLKGSAQVVIAVLLGCSVQ